MNQFELEMKQEVEKSKIFGILLNESTVLDRQESFYKVTLMVNILKWFLNLLPTNKSKWKSFVVAQTYF